MRVVFMGSPPFATPVLEALLASPHAVVALVTRPDRPRGRGQKVVESPLVAAARARGIECLQPVTTRDPAFVAALRALAPDVLLVASYGEILRQELLELAPHGALNVHASLLPRHRGASPIQSTLLAGDARTGVSVQRMVKALDEGDVLLALETPVQDDETAGELLARLAGLGGEAAVRALDALASGSARFTPQDPAQATFARKIRKEDGWIDWTRPAAEIERFVRAMTPWPGARTRLADGTANAAGAELVLLRVRGRAQTTALAPGTLLADERMPVVAAAGGVIEILELKPAGKGAVDGAAWLRGARLAPGTRLGN